MSTGADEAGQVTLLHDGRIATVTVDNPERRNAVSLEMWRSLTGHLEVLEDDPDVRVVVIRGAGARAFISGADISRFERERSDEAGVATYNEAAADAYEAVEACRHPTVAMIHGACVGGGVNVAVACDLRVCGTSARFGVTAARLGVGYGYDAVRRLAAVVGQAGARELLLTGQLVDADRALQLGLVSRVVADDVLDETCATLTSAIAENAPLTVRSVKEMCRALADPSEPADVDRFRSLVEACFSSQDYVEGRRAFMEKRAPRFEGR